MGADFYTGHLVYESPGMHKVTDLSPVTPELLGADDGIAIKARIETEAGIIEKRIWVSDGEALIEQTVDLAFHTVPFGSLRLCHVTLNPKAFDRNTLFYEAHNGGCAPERFEIEARRIDHSAPISFLVSAGHALGITEGVFSFGDARKAVVVDIDKQTAALVGQVTFRDIGNSYFLRFSPSAGELDETSHRPAGNSESYHRRFRFRLSTRYP